MDLFVIALFEENNAYDKPSGILWLLKSVLSKLPPKKLLPYVEVILKQWGYIIHKDYQAAPGPEVRSDDDIEGLKESSSGQPHVVNGSEETSCNQNVNPGQLGLHFFEGQLNNVHPMSNGKFKITWVDIFKTSDLELLRWSPYLLMLKHGKFFDMRPVYDIVWEALAEYLLKGPCSVLEPVAKSYPIYFHSDVDNSSTQLDESRSVWYKNVCRLITVMGPILSLAVPLLHGDYDKFKKTFGQLVDGLPSSDKAKKHYVSFFYFITQQLIPDLQGNVKEVLSELLDEKEFNELKSFYEIKRSKNQLKSPPDFKVLECLVRRVNNGQVEVALVDIPSST
ncbi:hypothetical protein IWQ61_010438 [Dispira simplex]|nr:hypothetical protein IWQ61_010438 [Dispira simplex]